MILQFISVDRSVALLFAAALPRGLPPGSGAVKPQEVEQGHRTSFGIIYVAYKLCLVCYIQLIVCSCVLCVRAQKKLWDSRRGRSSSLETYTHSFIHGSTHAVRIWDGSTMHRLAGVVYCKAGVMYSKEQCITTNHESTRSEVSTPFPSAPPPAAPALCRKRRRRSAKVC